MMPWKCPKTPTQKRPVPINQQGQIRSVKNKSKKNAPSHLISSHLIWPLFRFIGPSRLSGPLAVAAHNLDLVRADGLLVIQLKIDILDEESPDFVAESICVKVALQTENTSDQHPLFHPRSATGNVPKLAKHKRARHTLKFNRVRTLSASTSVIIRSKVERIFMASWGSIRPSLIRSSRVSVKDRPRLVFSNAEC